MLLNFHYHCHSHYHNQGARRSWFATAAPATGTLLAVFCCLGLGVAASVASAAPAQYNRIFLESSIASSPTAHTEIESLEEGAATLDVTAETIEFGASQALEAIRAFDLADPGADGASLLAQTSSKSNSCDGAPPCPESLSIVNRYLTLADMTALYRPKALLAPANELAFATQAVGARAQGEASGVVFEALVAQPASLALADLMGTYRLAVYTHELERDVAGNTAEFGSISSIALTFNGDGTCSGNSFGGGEVEQASDWPVLDSRSSVFAALEAADSFLSCSYTVDSGAGTTTLTLEISDGGDTFTVNLNLFVSAQNRYLTGRLVGSSENGVSSGTELSLFVGVKTAATAPSNADLSGVYFMSSFGETFSGADTLGIDGDFATRSVLSFSGGAADGEGFSSCTIEGSAYAGPLRLLGGSVPSPTASTVEFSGDAPVVYDSCRYRVEDAQSATLELSGQGAVVQTVLGLSDDQQTLLGTRLTTSEDPLDEGFNTELSVPGVATLELLVLQRYSGTTGDAQAMDFAAPIVPALDTNVVLVASVLPGSRSVPIGQTATAFATVINAGSVAGIGCDIRYGGSRSLSFTYQQTDPVTNAPVGEQNAAVDIPAGNSFQTYFFGITPFEEFSAENIELDFSCLNSASVAPIVGLNTLLLSSTSSPGPDVVALGATVTNDGISHLAVDTRAGFFSVASFNVGVQDNMEVSVDTGSATLPIVTSVCQTDPATGVCINPTVPAAAPVAVLIGAGATPTFAVFITASEDIVLDPANKRVFVRFRDSTGIVRGATSVAVQTD